MIGVSGTLAVGLAHSLGLLRHAGPDPMGRQTRSSEPEFLAGAAICKHPWIRLRSKRFAVACVKRLHVCQAGD